jgi:F-box-like
MSSLRLSDVSVEVLREILSYLDEPVYLGRLARVCRPLLMGIHDDSHLWERVYSSRWAADLSRPYEEGRYGNEVQESDVSFLRSL